MKHPLRASCATSMEIGHPAKGRQDARAGTSRREPDAATSKKFAAIHRNREQFSVAKVGKAFAKARTAKVG